MSLKERIDLAVALGHWVHVFQTCMLSLPVSAVSRLQVLTLAFKGLPAVVKTHPKIAKVSQDIQQPDHS